MPFPNEHSARIKDPGQFTSFARKNIAPGIDIVLGIKEGKSTAQAYRFKKSQHTAAEAKAWLRSHNISYISFEAASGKGELKGGDCIMCNTVHDESDGVCPECGNELIMYKDEYERQEMKLDVKEVPEVEIMEAGTWKGHKYTEKDFDEAIINFNNGVLEPYVNIDHNDKLTGQMRRMLNVMSFGFVSKLYRNGKKLLADFKQVPKLIAELIVAGALKKRSVEWWTKYDHANGKILNNVLEAVTFHGANGVPAVNTLADVVKLYKDDYRKPTDIKGEKMTIDFKQEELELEEIKIQKSEYDKLKADAAKADELKAVEAERDEAKKELKVEQDKSAEVQTKLDASEKKFKDKETADLKAEAEGYMGNLIEKENKLLPKYKDMKVAEYIRLKTAGDEDGLKLFKDELESRGKIMNFGPIAKGEQDVSTLEFKSEKGDITGDPTERAEAAIQAIMKRDDCSYEEAAKKAKIPGIDFVNPQVEPEFGGGK